MFGTEISLLECQLFFLPVKYGGLGIPSACVSAPILYTTSRTPPSALLTLSLTTHCLKLLLMKLLYSLLDPIIPSHVSNALTNCMQTFFNNLILSINDLFKMLVIILCQFGYLLYLLNRISFTPLTLFSVDGLCGPHFLKHLACCLS